MAKSVERVGWEKKAKCEQEWEKACSPVAGCFSFQISVGIRAAKL
jgi:hypothetical protein